MLVLEETTVTLDHMVTARHHTVRVDEVHETMDRPSWLLPGLSTRSDVFVAYGGESLAGWTDTGRALGATDGVRTVVRRTLDAGHHWLGGVLGSAGPYVVFARER